MKILIAGSSGFVGKNFVEKLSTSTHTILSLSRKDLDLSNSEQLTNICKDFKPDLLIHCAVSLTSSDNNLAMYFSLENASPYCGKCVMIGSGAEYSHQRYEPLMNEDYFDPYSFPLNQNPYHISKFTISRLHQLSPRNNIFNFRVFGLYGKYEDYSRRLISNNIFTYLSSGKMTYNQDISFDYLYVDDLLDAILCFSDSSVIKHKTYNVYSGISCKFSSILSECIQALGGSSDSIVCKDSTPTSYCYSGDCSRFESEFNHKISKTTFAAATIQLAEWLQPLI